MRQELHTKKLYAIILVQQGEYLRQVSEFSLTFLLNELEI